MKNYLALTGLSDCWDIESRLFLLGPWCISENTKKILENKEYTVVPSPFKPAYKIKEAADYCDNLYEKLLPQITSNLNKIHEISFSEKYWRIIVGPWLYFFIGTFYDRFKRIQHATTLFDDFYLHALPLGQCSPLCFDAYDFISSKVNDHFYNFKLFSLAAFELCPMNIKEISIDIQSRPAFRKYSLRSRLQWALHNKILSGGNILLSEMVYLTLLDKLKIKLSPELSGVGFYEFTSRDDIDPAPDRSSSIRGLLNFTSGNDNFEIVLYRILRDAMPTSYIELYNKHSKNAGNLKGMQNKKMIGSTYGWYFNEPFKFYAAACVSRGSKSVEFQHGGGYGMFLANPNEKIALQKDGFCTFGWKSNEFPEKTYPLANYYLARIQGTHKQELKKVVFVGTDRQKYHYKFVTHTNPEDMEQYLISKQKFFDLLNSNISSNLLYRPRLIKPVWETTEMIERLMPNVQIIREKTLVEWMQKVALVVIDHPHAAILEALSINVPSIFYWDHDVYLMNTDAEQYFQILRDTGILHLKSDSAAGLINNIWPDTQDWWMQSHRQSARKEFMDKYCKSDRNWKNQWANVFKKILDSN
jgi:putative transferase (TIGR04331 family)